MKQPALDRLENAVKELMSGNGDPLNLVNAFLVTKEFDEQVLNEYWTHRICALAEIIDKCAKEKKEHNL